MSESIVAAAVRVNDGFVVSIRRPARHNTVMSTLLAHKSPEAWKYEMGFLTSEGRFVTREEAGAIVGTPGVALTTEDLW